MEEEIPDFIKKRIIKKNIDEQLKFDNDDINIMLGITLGIIVTIIFVLIIKYF